MNKRHQKTLDVFFRPVSGSINGVILNLFLSLWLQAHEREGLRIAVLLKGQKKIFHRLHPRPTIDKGCDNSFRIRLGSLGIKP